MNHRHFHQCNSRAVSLLQKGDSEGAIRMLKEGLARIRSRIQEQEQRQQYSSDQPFLPCYTPIEIYSVSVLDDELCDTLNSRSHDNLFSFYPRMFICTHGGKKNDVGEETEDFSLLLVTMLYNLALTCHACAFGDNAKQVEAKSLHYAETMYQSALEVASSSLVETDYQEYMPLLLGIINNLGWCHSHRTNFVGTKQCVMLLSDLLPTISIVDQHMNEDFFYLLDTTMTLLVDQTLTRAPAA